MPRSSGVFPELSIPTQDGGLICADVYGKGPRGFVLARGGRFNKGMILLEGSAHAQFIFGTDQGERAMREILRFLSEP